MERRKAEAREQFKTLKQECEITVKLLSELLQMCSRQISIIDNLDSKTFRQYSKFFLAILQFQSLSKQKVLEWNFDLEEFLTEKCVAEPESFPITSDQNINLSLCESINTNAYNFIDNKCNLDSTNLENSYSNTTTTNDNEKELSSRTIEENINVKDKTNTSTVISDKEEFYISPDNLNDSFATCEFRSDSSITGKDDLLNLKGKSVCLAERYTKISKTTTALEVLDPLPVTSTVENCSSTGTFKDAESSESSSTTDILKSLPVMTIEEKCSKSLCKSIEVSPRTLPLSVIHDDKRYSFNPESINYLSSGTSMKGKCIEKRDINYLSTATKSNEALNPSANKNKVVDDTFDRFDDSYFLQNIENVTKSEVKQIEEESLNTSKIINVKNRIPPRLGDTCMIGHVESPGEFYIQVVDENVFLIDNLPNELSTLYKDSSFVHTSKNDIMKIYGNFYAAYIENCWYRVEVINWMMPEESDVMIQLIDYGHKYKVGYEELYPLVEAMCKLPKMAQLCHLGYLYPPNATIDNRLEDWSEENIEKILEILGDLNDTVFKLVHVYYCKERNSYEVDLLNVEETNEEKTIGQILIEKALAVQILDDDSEAMRNSVIMNQIRTAHGLNGIDHNMSLEEILDKYFEQTLRNEPANINEAIMNYNPRDEAETCKNLRPDGTCYKGKRCQFRHTPLTSGFTMDKVPVYDRAFEEEVLPQKGEEVMLCISHVVDIQHFYAQIRKQNKSVVNHIETLSGLINVMNDAKRVKKYKSLKYPPSIGQMVIAKHWNNYWYRGQVRFVGLPENSDAIEVEVYIVDFGDIMIMPMTDLREMIPEFLHLSFQAIECRLYNVKPKSDVSIEDQKQHFGSMYLGQTYKAKVIATPGYLELLMEDAQGNDIGARLIEDGFGELRTEHYFPHESELLLVD